MKHILSTDMLEGFEHTSILASASGDGKSKELVTVTKVDKDNQIYTGLRVINMVNGVVKSTTYTTDLKKAIEVYNEL